MAMLPSVLLAFLFYFLLLGFQPTQSAKIVGYPMFGGSQYIGMKRIAEELVSRGHEVTLLVNNAQKIKPTKGITHAVYQVPYPKDFLETLLVSGVIKKGIMKSLFSDSDTSIPTVQRTFCEALLNDTELLNPLKKFDLIITDTSMLCGPVVADYLDIMRIEYCPISPRFLSIFTPYESLLTLSYVPLYMSLNPGSMNFFQRTKNTLINIAGQLAFPLLMARPFEQIKQKYNIKPERSYMESMENKELTLFLADFALEYTYPVLPSMKYRKRLIATTGMLCQPANSDTKSFTPCSRRMVT